MSGLLGDFISCYKNLLSFLFIRTSLGDMLWLAESFSLSLLFWFDVRAISKFFHDIFMFNLIQYKGKRKELLISAILILFHFFVRFCNVSCRHFSRCDWKVVDFKLHLIDFCHISYEPHWDNCLAILSEQPMCRLGLNRFCHIGLNLNLHILTLKMQEVLWFSMVITPLSSLSSVITLLSV